MKRNWIMLAALAAFAGPAPAQPAPPEPIVTARDGYELRLLPGGLAAGHPGLHSYPVFPFGLSRTEAITRVAALRGRAGGAGNRSCGGRMLNFARFGTLTLWFRGNLWVGWSLAGPPGRRPIRSEWDMGIGMTRAGIDRLDGTDPVYRRTARGTEFTADEMHGRLAGRGRQARIAELWAGEVCR